MAKILGVKGREILDSRGNPTVEVWASDRRETKESDMAKIVRTIGREILDSAAIPPRKSRSLEEGAYARAAVPSGASTGVHEALELRDGDKARYGGKGTLKAVEHVNREIAGALLGLNALDQRPSTRRCWRWTARRTRGNWGRTPSWASAWRWRAPRRPRSGLPLYRYLGGMAARVLPVPMFNILNGGRPRQLAGHRLPGVHDRSGGRTHVPRGRALGERDLPCAQGGAEGERPFDRRRRRGRVLRRRSRPTPRRSS